MDKRIIIGTGVAATLLVGGSFAAQQFGAEPKVKLDNPQQIVWEKPTTDEQWAEDVKKENFDIKSTKKLEEMRDVHTLKLQKMMKNNAKIFDCIECVKYDIKTVHPEYTVADIDTEYADQLTKITWEIEKLQQSVERMDKELELRTKGFVVVEGEKETLLGALTKPYAIRQIND